MENGRSTPIAIRVLLVEDDENDAALLLRFLTRNGYELTSLLRVDNESDMVAALENNEWDVVLSDYKLPTFDAPHALTVLQQYLQQSGKEIPFIVVSGTMGEETAVGMMKAGAADYLLKDKLQRLAPAIARELREAAGRRERQRAEQALRDSEARFSGLVSSVSEAIISVDQEHQITLFNPAAERMFGWTSESVIGKPLHRFLPDRAQTLHDDRLREFTISSITQMGHDQLGMLSAIRADGTEFPIEASISQVQVGGSQISTAVIRDISERFAADQTRRELENRFREMADTAPVLIWVVDTDGRGDWFNKGWLDFTGHSLEQAVRAGWTADVHPEDIENCLRMYRTAFERYEPFRIEFRLRRRDGEYRWMLNSGTPRFSGTSGPSATFVGYIGSCVDVTEKKNAEQERILAGLQQRAFLRDVLSSVTEGHLALCISEEDLPKALTGTMTTDLDANIRLGSVIPLTSATLSEVRRQVRVAASLAGFSNERAMGVMSAASECAMNAVTHGGDLAKARIHMAEDGSAIQVWVTDHGRGIDVSELPKATLMKGYSGSGGAGGFGHGFFLMLQFVDKIYLLTGPQGTTIVIEQAKTPPPEEFGF